MYDILGSPLSWFRGFGGGAAAAAATLALLSPTHPKRDGGSGEEAMALAVEAAAANARLAGVGTRSGPQVNELLVA